MGRAGFVQPGIQYILPSNLRRSARSFFIVLCFLKANDRITGLRDIQASGCDRLLRHPSESQSTSLQKFVTPR